MNTNEIIGEKLKEFIEKVEEKCDNEKKFFHYQSVKNISSRIINYNDKKAALMKVKLLTYFEELKIIGYCLKDDKIKSSQLHNEHLHPISLYLFSKENFLSNSDLSFFVIIGIIIDFSLFFFIPKYPFPFCTLLFMFSGIYRRYQAKKRGKYSGMFW